jgi:hypothetical protein
MRATSFQRVVSNFLSTVCARVQISVADHMGREILEPLLRQSTFSRLDPACSAAVEAYREAFHACSKVVEYDKLAFQSKWFKDFYQRNFDALMIKSMYDNVMDDIDHVRDW